MADTTRSVRTETALKHWLIERWNPEADCNRGRSYESTTQVWETLDDAQAECDRRNAAIVATHDDEHARRVERARAQFDRNMEEHEALVAAGLREPGPKPEFQVPPRRGRNSLERWDPVEIEFIPATANTRGAQRSPT